jgi:hypothetical protein
MVVKVKQNGQPVGEFDLPKDVSIGRKIKTPWGRATVTATRSTAEGKPETAIANVI